MGERTTKEPTDRGVQARRLLFIVVATLVQLAFFVAVGFVFVFLL